MTLGADDRLTAGPGGRAGEELLHRIQQDQAAVGAGIRQVQNDIGGGCPLSHREAIVPLLGDRSRRVIVAEDVARAGLLPSRVFVHREVLVVALATPGGLRRWGGGLAVEIARVPT